MQQLAALGVLGVTMWLMVFAYNFKHVHEQGLAKSG
jgi:hypothetical protein